MKKNEILVKNFQKNLKNSNFSQNFLNPCKKFKKKFEKSKIQKEFKKIQKNLKKNSKILKNSNFSQQKFKNSTNFQKFSNFF